MSISTSGGDQRRPSVVSTGKKPPAGGKPVEGDTSATGKKPASSKPAGAKPAARSAGGKGPRKPVSPVRVSQGRAWGPIALFVAVGVIAAGIIGYGAYAVVQGGKGWEDKAAGIDGIVNFRKGDTSMIDPLPGQQSHAWGPLQYKMSPPVGSTHNYNWQNCMGDVYDAPIANEHAVHSLEHGAVWITYKSGLAADQVEQLASKIRGTEFTMMSPVDDLDAPISLQAWGYQLKVDEADDGRIDEFISALRQNATMEPNASCSNGITAPGTTPRDIGKDQPQQGS